MKKTDDMILRGLFLAPKTDSDYSQRAFNLGISRGELFRIFIEFGQEFLEQNKELDADGLRAALDKSLKE